MIEWHMMTEKIRHTHTQQKLVFKHSFVKERKKERKNMKRRRSRMHARTSNLKLCQIIHQINNLLLGFHSFISICFCYIYIFY